MEYDPTHPNLPVSLIMCTSKFHFEFLFLFIYLEGIFFQVFFLLTMRKKLTPRMVRFIQKRKQTPQMIELQNSNHSNWSLQSSLLTIIPGQDLFARKLLIMREGFPSPSLNSPGEELPLLPLISAPCPSSDMNHIPWMSHTQWMSYLNYLDDNKFYYD